MSMTLEDLLDLQPAPDADLQHDDPTPSALVPLSGGGQMSRREQAFTAIRHAFRQARRNWTAAKKAKGGPIAWFENWHPESMAELETYRNSKAWVPAGHDGGTAEEVGTFFYRYVQPWLYRPGLFYLWVVGRLFRFCVALGLAALTAATVAYMLR